MSGPGNYFFSFTPGGRGGTVGARGGRPEGAVPPPPPSVVPWFGLFDLFLNAKCRNFLTPKFNSKQLGPGGGWVTPPEFKDVCPSPPLPPQSFVGLWILVTAMLLHWAMTPYANDVVERLEPTPGPATDPLHPRNSHAGEICQGPD